MQDRRIANSAIGAGRTNDHGVAEDIDRGSPAIVAIGTQIRRSLWCPVSADVLVDIHPPQV